VPCNAPSPGGGGGVPCGEQRSSPCTQRVPHDLQVIPRATLQGLPEGGLRLLHHPAGRRKHAEVAVPQHQARIRQHVVRLAGRGQAGEQVLREEALLGFSSDMDLAGGQKGRGATTRRPKWMNVLRNHCVCSRLHSSFQQDWSAHVWGGGKGTQVAYLKEAGVRAIGCRKEGWWTGVAGESSGGWWGGLERGWNLNEKVESGRLCFRVEGWGVEGWVGVWEEGGGGSP